MKSISLRTVALAAPIVSLLAFINCAPDDPTVTNTGGTSSTTAGSGTTPTAGTDGTTPTAGTPAMTGGTGPSAGTSAGGTGTGTGGASGGSAPNGGTGPSAGTSAGGTGTGGGSAGTGTGGGAGGGAGEVTVDSILSGESSYKNPGWKDSWWVTGCKSKHDHDCYTVEQCPAAGARTKETFPVGGVPGQHYKVTFKYEGLNEGRSYTGGKKDVPIAADAQTRVDNDSFHRDGTAQSTTYNELRLTVYDDKGMEARHYFMNSFPVAENHIQYSSAYTKSIVIVGGGKIEHMVFDSNCHAIDNCNVGLVNGTTCNSPRRLPGDSANLMLPPFSEDPKDNSIKATDLAAISVTVSRSQPWKAQASHLKVTAISVTTDPVTMDYP